MRLPFYKTFPADDETDEWFQALTDQQRGYYWRLKNHFWTNGSIPADSARRCSLFGIHHKTEQGCFKDLSRMFHEDPKDPSRMLHGPLQEQFMEFSRKSASATESVNHRYERTTAENANVGIRARVPDTDTESENPFPAEAGGKSPDGTPPDQQRMVRSDAPPPTEKPKSEAALAAEAACDITAKTIHGRHPKPRRDIGVKAVARLLRTILRQNGITVRVAPDKLAEIDRNHATMCESEGWQKEGGEFAKGLENWLCPSKGRYEVAAVVPIRAATRSISRAWDPTKDEEVG